MSASLKHQSLHSRTRYTHIYAPRNAGITGFCCIGPATREIKSARTVLIKSWEFQLFTSTILAVFFYYRRIARKAEAGRGGSPRSINKSAMCPAMWRLTFSDRRTVSPTIRKRLSATSSEHGTYILRSGIPPRPASDLS